MIATSLLAILFGLIFGSFANVIIHRIPQVLIQVWEDPESAENMGDEISMSIRAISWPSSHCPQCSVALKWYHNIPIISWLVLKAQCAFCQEHIAARYPITELTMGVLGYASYALFAPDITLACIAFFYCWTLYILAMIDHDSGLLPDVLTLPLLWAGILFALKDNGSVVPLSHSINGVIWGYCGFRMVGVIYRLARGYEGMGGGDYKLVAAIGAWVGYATLPAVVLLSTGIALVQAVVMVLFTKKQPKQEEAELTSEEAELQEPQGLTIRFGPALAVAGIVLWVQVMLFPEYHLVELIARL